MVGDVNSYICNSHLQDLKSFEHVTQNENVDNLSKVIMDVLIIKGCLFEFDIKLGNSFCHFVTNNGPMVLESIMLMISWLAHLFYFG